jgi:hypothetical protein
MANARALVASVTTSPIPTGMCQRCRFDTVLLPGAGVVAQKLTAWASFGWISHNWSPIRKMSSGFVVAGSSLPAPLAKQRAAFSDPVGPAYAGPVQCAIEVPVVSGLNSATLSGVQAWDVLFPILPTTANCTASAIIVDATMPHPNRIAHPRLLSALAATDSKRRITRCTLIGFSPTGAASDHPALEVIGETATLAWIGRMTTPEPKAWSGLLSPRARGEKDSTLHSHARLGICRDAARDPDSNLHA